MLILLIFLSFQKNISRQDRHNRWSLPNRMQRLNSFYQFTERPLIFSARPYNPDYPLISICILGPVRPMLAEPAKTERGKHCECWENKIARKISNPLATAIIIPFTFFPVILGIQHSHNVNAGIKIIVISSLTYVLCYYSIFFTLKKQLLRKKISILSLPLWRLICSITNSNNEKIYWSCIYVLFFFNK